MLAIAAILILEAFVPVVPVGVIGGETWAGLLSGVALGAIIGAIAALLGVAGGEFLIPTLILVYGASATTAGTASLAISIVAVTAGLVRYRSMKMLPARGELRRIALPMGAASIVGAIPGGMLAAAAPDTTLKLILGAILIAAAAKTLQHRP